MKIFDKLWLVMFTGIFFTGIAVKLNKTGFLDSTEAIFICLSGAIVVILFYKLIDEK